MDMKRLVALGACGWALACGGDDTGSVGQVANEQGGTGGSAGHGDAGAGGSGGADGGAGGVAGAGGTTGPSLSSCAPGAPRAYGVPLDAARGCADTEAIGTEIACIDPGEIKAGYFCARRLSDGQEFIGFSPLHRPVIDAPGWEACPWDGMAPPPCHGLTCERGSPMSTCTLAETTKRFSCGNGTTELDRDCCLRRECVSDADCAASQTCKEVGGMLSWECWSLGPAGTCDCGGLPATKVPRAMCVDLTEL